MGLQNTSHEPDVQNDCPGHETHDHPFMPQWALVSPAWQVLPEMQPVQQLPDRHCPLPPPHEVLLGLLVLLTHTGPPLAQLMTPVMQSLGLVVHEAPAVHATQLPALQTPPGQAVPAARLAPSTQTGEPELHEMLPALHGLLGVHPAPALQGLHEPALQTPPGQAVPLALLEPLTQTPLPDEQSMTPF